ncbi:MAG: pitrilysin family protein [Pseudobdellovibrionaceae bacterium]|nr:pitrilysin family protein [Pseudobdellovibrionaceae bacterium]
MTTEVSAKVHSDQVVPRIDPKDLEIKLNVTKFTLANGLTVLLNPDPNIPLISFHTWYRVGSRDEKPGITGAAHMLEHMMFKGAKKYSGKDFDRILHENGIVNNAFTSWDFTGFYERLPSHRLELVMDLEVDRMRFLKLDPNDLGSELQVVGEERRMRIDNNPPGLLYETLFSLVFGGSSYEWPIIGYMKDIQSYTTDKLKYFYDTFYLPNNAVLVLVGDFKPDQARELIERYYGNLPSRPLEKRNYSHPQKIMSPVKKILKKNVQAESLALAYQSTSIHESDRFALELLGYILGGGVSSRLSASLIYGKEVASRVSAFQMSQDLAGVFVIIVYLRSGKSYLKAHELCREEIKKIQEQGVSEAELQKVKNQIMKEFVDNLVTLDGRARTLAEYEIYYGNYQRLFDDLKLINQVTTDDIQRVARAYLDPNREVMVTLVPEK